MYVVIRVFFSSGSDGLVKIWTVKTNECVTTLDQHTEKVTQTYSPHMHSLVPEIISLVAVVTGQQW